MRHLSLTRAACLITAILLSLGAECESGEAWPGEAVKSSQPTLVLAEYQVWHGLPSHSGAFSGADWLPFQRPYDSRDPVVIARHIAKAKAKGIDGFVVDWYGPPAGVGNDGEREFMDQATAALLAEAEAQGFKIALLYDEGTITQASVPVAEYATRVAADLVDAEKYYSSPAYLRRHGTPTLFVFPYDAVDSRLDWSAIRGSLSTEVLLFDKDPDPENPTHDSMFDGFYAWVQPESGSDTDGRDWGKGYLHWFYSTMRSASYVEKTAVGGVWPGFDDSLAIWGDLRFMSRQSWRVYDRTWLMAVLSHAPIVMIATWNDFEEGTDIEFGVRMVVDMEVASPEVLLRSSPFKVVWDRARGDGVVQVYMDGSVIFEESLSSGVYLAAESGQAYEIKVWVPDCPRPLVHTIKIRRQDPIPFVSPIDVH